MDLERQRTVAENVLETDCYDFTAKYMAVCDLHSLVKTNHEIINSKTVSALKGVLKDSGLSRQKQSFFVYKEAADALASVIVRTIGEPMADRAISALKAVLGTAAGNAQRAATEALGSLPVSVHGPKISEDSTEDIPQVEWQEILKEVGVKNHGAPVVIGRSLVACISKENRLLVVKLACAHDSFRTLCRETLWMEHLSSEAYSFPVRFSIPMAVKINGSYVFRLEDRPVKIHDRPDLHPQNYAICFVAPEDYFNYPNGYRTQSRPTMEEFREVMFRDAWLLGKLASLGIVHSAPIPLFHNRVQRGRRADNGIYEWPRGGRLDRWLDSCCYPNFGPTGIRDFEHLVAFEGSGRNLYQHIGAHILSLLLVTGSYFRNKDRGRVGLDGQGRPVDARDLFDKQFLKEVARGIFLGYYHGFVGRQLCGELPFDLVELSSRMIEEMGVDRHMEEVLRVVDQEQMTDEQFRDFLRERGYSDNEMGGFKRGSEDIIIRTGPHLGAFNQRISLPELIESVGIMSALCIVGKYRQEKSSEPASLPSEDHARSHFH
ncbi:MAG: SidJ-related pseudokinase [Desulfobacterales bacterium]|nr:SidJ-related pseudokinase [Desulfobacterales bacterium]